MNGPYGIGPRQKMCPSELAHAKKMNLQDWFMPKILSLVKERVFRLDSHPCTHDKQIYSHVHLLILDIKKIGGQQVWSNQEVGAIKIGKQDWPREIEAQ